MDDHISCPKAHPSGAGGDGGGWTWDTMVHTDTRQHIPTRPRPVQGFQPTVSAFGRRFQQPACWVTRRFSVTSRQRVVVAEAATTRVGNWRHAQSKKTSDPLGGCCVCMGVGVNTGRSGV